MASLDIFNNDAFSLTNLSLAMTDLPYKPKRLDELGLFDERGITSTSFMIEKKGNQLSLVPSAPRGAPGRPVKGNKSALRSFVTTHLPQSGAIMADQVQNIRAFGTETELQTVQQLVNDELSIMKNAIDATHEWQRMGAIKGQVIDADGTSVLVDMFAEFGVTQQTQAMALATATTKVRQLVIQQKRKIEAELGGLGYSGLRVLCSPGFFDAFVEHSAVTRAYDNFQDRQMLQADLRTGFRFADVVWEEYRGTVGGQDFIADGEAYLVPEGVDGLFITRFAPANYMETVNTIGLPYYAKQQLMDYNKGVEIESQSNPISLCTRPRAVIKLTA